MALPSSAPWDGPAPDPLPEKRLYVPYALERDASLEEGGRVAELPPSDVRPAKKGGYDHLDRAIPEGSRDAQGLMAESDGIVVVASVQELVHHEGGDPREPVLVAERPGEHLRLVEVLAHARPIAQRAERVPEVYVEVDGQLGRLPGLGEAAEGPERLLQVDNGLAVGGPRHGPEPRPAEIGDRLLPQLPVQGVMGQALGLLGDALGREPLEAAACEGGAWQYATTDASAAVLVELTRVVPHDLEAPLFPSLRDLQRPMDEGELRRLTERTPRRAKVRPRSPEQFRHTFVSTLLSGGAPPLYVASQTGHSQQTIFKFYSKWIDQARAVDARSMQPSATPPQPGLRPGAVTHQTKQE